MKPTENTTIVTKIGEKFIAKKDGLKAPVNGKYVFGSGPAAKFPLAVKVYSTAQVADEDVRGLANDALILAAHGEHKALIMAAIGVAGAKTAKTRIVDAN